MNRWAKVGIGAAALGVLAVGLLIWNVNPIVQSLRPQITEIIAEKLNAPIKIGALEVRIFPSLAIQVVDVSVASDQPERSLVIKNLTLNTSLLQLLRGDIDVTELSIENGALTLVRGADRSIRIGGLGGERPALSHSTHHKKDADPEAASDGEKRLALQVRTATVKNLAISYVDNAVTPPQHINARIESAELHDISPTEIGKIELRASVLGTAKDNLKFSGKISLPDMQMARAAVQGSGSLHTLDLAKLREILGAYSVKLENISLGNTADIDFKLNSSDKGIHLQSTFSGKEAEIRFGDTFIKPQGQMLSFSAEGDGALNGSFEASAASLTLGGNVIEVPFTLKPPAPIQFKIAAKSLVLDDLGKFVPPLQKFEPRGTLAVNIAGLYGVVGQKNQDAPAELTTKGTISFQNVGAKLSAEKPLELSGLTGTVELNGNSFSTKDLTGEVAKQKLDLGLSGNFTPEKMALQPSTVGIWGGKLNLSGEMQRVGSKVVTFDVHGGGLNLAALSKAIAPNKLSLSGTLSNLATSGTAQSGNFSQTLAGRAKATASQGAIEGINIVGSALAAIDKIPGVEGKLLKYVPEKYAGVFTGDNTPFDSLNGDLRFLTGRAELDNIALQHALYIISGTGWFAFGGDFNVDGQLKLTPLMAQGMLLKEPKLKLLLDKENNLTIPLVVSRKEGHILVLPDVSRLLQSGLRNAAKEAAAKQLEKVVPGLGGASKLLDSLFKK